MRRRCQRLSACPIAVFVWACSAAVPPTHSTASANAPKPLAQREPPKAPQMPEPLPALRVGTSGDYAPFSTRDAAGVTSGFDAELAERLAHDLGMEVEWVPFLWPQLGAELASGKFDVAMGGITWQPTRGVTGYMTRAVARGGPCVLGDAAARRIAVNHGGFLEAWARAHLRDRELVVVDDNRSLPDLLAAGRVGAIVTDSFERRAFARPGWAERCEPALARKVYWVGPARARELGVRIDAWLRSNVTRVHAAQERWFGERQRLDATTHLIDLLARRFAFMPIVAGLKAQQNLPIEDLPREREVLAGVNQTAQRLGLPAERARDLFALQIELSKAVQRRQSEPSKLQLGEQIRPALTELGERILDALAEVRAEPRRAELSLPDFELLSPWLSLEERGQLLGAVRAVLAP